MKKFLKVLKVFIKAFVIAIIVLVFITLLVGNFRKNRKIEKQEKVIQYYETTYLGENSETSVEISELESQLEEANSKVAELEQQINGVTNDETYLNIAFPTDGNYYKDAYDEVKFYADSSCTIEVAGKVRFMSATQKQEQAKNGLQIYCLRMDSGKICYCTESPYLITEQKYIEMKNEE